MSKPPKAIEPHEPQSSQSAEAGPTFGLSVELVNGIAAYLSLRPWGEVNALLMRLDSEVRAQGATPK